MRFEAIVNTHPNVTTLDGEINAFDSSGAVVIIDEVSVANELKLLASKYNSTQYQRDRVYPTIQEQLDMQYHDAVNGTTTWKDAILAIKAKYPKPL